MPKRIPVTALKTLCEEQGLQFAVLLGFDGKLSHIVSYGDSADSCSHAAELGNKIKRGLGWPESLCNAEPSSYKKLQDRIAELEKLLKLSR